MAEFRQAMATERDYSHRSTVQKLGVARDQRVEIAGDVGPGLRRDVKEAIGRGLVKSGDLDGAIVLVESEDEAKEAFVRYRARLRDTGYLWMITRKRGHDRYLNQMALVPFGEAARPDRQQDLLDRRRALRHPLRDPTGTARQRQQERRVDPSGVESPCEHRCAYAGAVQADLRGPSRRPPAPRTAVRRRVVLASPGGPRDRLDAAAPREHRAAVGPRDPDDPRTRAQLRLRAPRELRLAQARAALALRRALVPARPRTRGTAPA